MNRVTLSIAFMFEALSDLNNSGGASKELSMELLEARDKLVMLLLHWWTLTSSHSLHVGQLRALTALARCPPLLESSVRAHVVSVALSLLSQGSDGDREPEEENVVETLQDLLTALQQGVSSPRIMLQLLHEVESWLTSPRVLERRRASEVYVSVLQSFVAQITMASYAETTSTTSTTTSSKRSAVDKTPGLGHFLSRLLPRCHDSDGETRRFASEALQTLLYIDQVENAPGELTPSPLLKQLTERRRRWSLSSAPISPSSSSLDDSEPQQAWAQALTPFLSAAQDEYLPRMVSAIDDPDASAAQGAALTLTTIVDTLGDRLQGITSSFVTAAMPVLDKTRSRSTIHHQVVQVIMALARHQPQAVIGSLLSHPLPLSLAIRDVLQALVAHSELSVMLMETLVTVLATNDTFPGTEQASNHFHMVNVATTCLQELCAIPDAHALLQEHWATLLVTLMCGIGRAHQRLDSSAAS